MQTIESGQMATEDIQPATTSAPARRAGIVSTLWQAFKRFRTTRPLVGCLILAWGGYLVMQPILGGSFEFMMHMGAKGMVVYLLGGGMMTAALVALVVPSQRHFPALMALGFSVASLPLANLGGWIIGMVLGIIGSGLIFAWTPYNDKQLAKFAERARVKNARAAAKATAKVPAKTTAKS
jgi:hypothetical protein